MKHTLYYLLTGLENIVSYLSRDHGHNPRYWRRKLKVIFLFSVPPPLPKEPPHEKPPHQKVHFSAFRRHPAGPLPRQRLVPHYRSVPRLPVARSRCTSCVTRRHLRVRTIPLDITPYPRERRYDFMLDFPITTCLALHLQRENGHDPRFSTR